MDASRPRLSIPHAFLIPAHQKQGRRARPVPTAPARIGSRCAQSWKHPAAARNRLEARREPGMLDRVTPRIECLNTAEKGLPSVQ